jgi:hypothetical protein
MRSVDALAQDRNVEILHAGQAANWRSRAVIAWILALHTGQRRVRTMASCWLEFWATALVYRRAVNHHAQRRDDSYRR